MASSRLLPAALLVLLAVGAPDARASRDGITRDGGGSSIAFVAPSIAPPPGPPCEGNNHLADDYFDGALMGGPIVGISWIPTASVNVRRVEVFTGEAAAPSFLAIWSDDGGAPSRPLAALAVTGSFLVAPPNAWYGSDLDTTVSVTAGTKYWVAWDPTGGEQCACTDSPADVQQTYWGSNLGTVSGGTDWFGPFSFPDRRWKFRMYCEDGDADGDGVPDEADLCPDTLLPELAATVDLGVNRWADVDGDGEFDTTPSQGTGPQVTFTMLDTGGCSCSQIVEALGIGLGHEKHGCSLGIMRRWVDSIAP
jgi:hypothetical protein